MTDRRQTGAPSGSAVLQRGTPRRLQAGLGMVAVVAVVVIALRLAAALTIADSPLLKQPVLEDAEYRLRAIAALEGSLSEQGLPRGSALYPLLVSRVPGLEDEGGSRRLAVAQSILEGLTALLLMLWARRRWGTRVAIAAGLLYAIDPLGAFFAARFSPVVPATLALVGTLWLLDTGQERASALRSAAAGIVAAIGFLLLALPFLLLAVIHLVVRARSGAARRDVAIAALPLALVLLAGVSVSARHATLRDGAPFLNWGTGLVADAAFDPATGGTARDLKPPSWRTETTIRTQAWESLEREGTRRDLLTFYAARGLGRAAENPVSTAGVILSKSAAAISAWPVPDALSPAFLFRTRAPLLSGWAQVSFAVLFGVGLAGLLSRRSDPTGRILALGLLAVAFALVAGTVSAASRQVALPLLAALGGGWISAALARTRMRPAAAIALTAGMTASLLAGWFAPSARLRNPSEDLRLLAARTADNPADAVILLEGAVHSDPANLEARVALAAAYQGEGLLGPAEEQLYAAYALDPTHAGTLMALTATHQNRGETEQALAHMRRLVELRPNSPLYLNQLGLLLVGQNEINEAYNLFRRALVLKPDYTTAQQNLQMIEMYKQRMESSLLNPDMRLAADDPVNVLLGRIARALESAQWSEADSLLSHVERERPDLVQPHWFRAGYHARRGDVQSAVAALEVCQRMAPGRPMIVRQLAEYYFQLGQDRKVEPLILESIAAAGRDSIRVVAFREMLEQVRR